MRALVAFATIIALISLALPAAAVVKPGAEVLRDRGYNLLAEKRVGLVTNHTARIASQHVLESMQASGVRVTALFGPEHGLYGVAEDGVSVDEAVEEKSGVKVFSLYGARRRPDRQMLKNVDILVFDIQDIGARFYTYISTMGLAMQAAAEAGIPFVVLDRPNPLGGEYVSGFVLDPRHSSFEGLYPVPIVHGMTVGELALMIKGEGMLPGVEKLDLQVIPMNGWSRSMRWPETGLPWIPTSPNIPDFDTALVYAGICFLEATRVSEGRGTLHPFKVMGLPSVNAVQFADTMNSWGLPGVVFEPYSFRPTAIAGMESAPKFLQEPVYGVRLSVTDHQAFLPLETGIFILSAFHRLDAARTGGKFFRGNGISRLAGTHYLRSALEADATPDDIIGMWQSEVESFRALREKYLLYQ